MSNLIDQLKRHEGLMLKPYRCTAGALTIGHGLNLDAGIDEGLAEAILVYQVDSIDESLQEYSWYSSLNPARQDVIVNMAFNLGLTGVMKFKKMIDALKCGFFELAAKEMLNSKWAKQVGNRAIELSNQMKSGQYE